MDIAVTRRAVIALTAVAWIGGPAVAFAAPEHFTVHLSGAHEVPPVHTSGTATAKLGWNPSTRIVTWNVQYEHLSSPATMAHFHGPAAPGKNGPVQVWLSKKGASSVPDPIKGRAKLSPTQAKEFTEGQWYINIHTKDHPAGEIRGQVEPPKG